MGRVNNDLGLIRSSSLTHSPASMETSSASAPPPENVIADGSVESDPPLAAAVSKVLPPSLVDWPMGEKSGEPRSAGGVIDVRRDALQDPLCCWPALDIGLDDHVGCMATGMSKVSQSPLPAG